MVTKDDVSYLTQKAGNKFSIHTSEELDNGETLSFYLENPSDSGTMFVIDALKVSAQTEVTFEAMENVTATGGDPEEAKNTLLGSDNTSVGVALLDADLDGERLADDWLSEDRFPLQTTMVNRFSCNLGHPLRSRLPVIVVETVRH